MRRRRDHNAYCEAFGVSPNVCNETNKWMDAPAKHGGGCKHREKRHSNSDCLKWSLNSDNILEGIERFFRACQIHRKADRKTDKCGSKALYD